MNRTLAICCMAVLPAMVSAAPAAEAVADSTTSWQYVSQLRRTRRDGFRVQVYVGGNSRDAKARALQVESRVHDLFPEVGAYTQFVSPRWLCHVGDFETRDEAAAFLAQLRAVGGFDEAIVVKSKIYVYVLD